LDFLELLQVDVQMAERLRYGPING